MSESQAHHVEMGDDGMIHCRTCGRSWWPHDPGRTMPDDICAADPVMAPGDRADGWVYISWLGEKPLSVGGLYATEAEAQEAADRDWSGGHVAPFFYVKAPTS